MSNDLKIASLLRQIAEELEPYIQMPKAHAAAANSKNLPSTWASEQVIAAKQWRELLTSYAEKFENDLDPPKAENRAEIRSILYRGMGSFSDFGLDSRIFGPKVKATNERVMALMSQMYSLFKT